MTSVRFKTKVIESIEGNLDSNQNQRLGSSNAIAPDELPPEALEAVKKMVKSHWKSWFNEKIPALNGKTPKQAAKTKDGRELLEALLDYYQQDSGKAIGVHTNLFKPDVAYLRKELGI